jgi:hypothetical protein
MALGESRIEVHRTSIHEYYGRQRFVRITCAASCCRALLAEKLIEGLDVVVGDELSHEWREEVRRRCEEIDQGTARVRDADDAFAEAYAKLI